MNTIKHLTLTLIMLIVVTGITSCGGGTPKGDDKDVIELVKHQYQSSLDTLTLHKAYKALEPTGAPDKGLSAYYGLNYLDGFVREVEFIDNESCRGDNYDDLDKGYAERMQLAKDRKDEKEVRALEQAMVKFGPICKAIAKLHNELLEDPDSIKIENIRTVSIDDKVKKSVSEATLNILGHKSNIRYSAQRDAEGELCLELWNLK